MPSMPPVSSTSLQPPVIPAFAPPDPNTFEPDPWRLNQGLKALQRGAAARGTLLTGGTQKALVDYGQRSASDEYQNAYERALQTYLTNRETSWQNYAHQNDARPSLAMTPEPQTSTPDRAPAPYLPYPVSPSRAASPQPPMAQPMTMSPQDPSIAEAIAAQQQRLSTPIGGISPEDIAMLAAQRRRAAIPSSLNPTAAMAPAPTQTDDPGLGWSLNQQFAQRDAQARDRAQQEAADDFARKVASAREQNARTLAIPPGTPLNKIQPIRMR